MATTSARPGIGATVTGVPAGASSTPISAPVVSAARPGPRRHAPGPDRSERGRRFRRSRGARDRGSGPAPARNRSPSSRSRPQASSSRSTRRVTSVTVTASAVAMPSRNVLICTPPFLRRAASADRRTRRSGRRLRSARDAVRASRAERSLDHRIGLPRPARRVLVEAGACGAMSGSASLALERDPRLAGHLRRTSRLLLPDPGAEPLLPDRSSLPVRRQWRAGAVSVLPRGSGPERHRGIEQELAMGVHAET